MSTGVGYIALAIKTGKRGQPSPGEMIECRSSDAAVLRAERFAKLHGSALAYARMRDGATGDFAIHGILAKFGASAEEVATQLLEAS